MSHDFEGSEGEMSVFMSQVMELLEKLNKKANIVTTRLLFLEQKVRKLKKEVNLLRLGEGRRRKRRQERKK